MHRSRRHRSRRRGAPVGAALAALALLLASCGAGGTDDAEPTTGQASAAAADEEESNEGAATEDAASPADEASTPDPPASEAPSADPSSDSDDTPGDGDFCDELAVFLDAWQRDEIEPADLTGEYRRLADIAPGELVDDLEVLADGNEEALATGGITDIETHDASGAAVATYAMDVCGIQPPG